MHAWDVLNLYCRADPRWFETLSRYQAGAEHLAEYRGVVPPDWSLRRRGLWFIATPPGNDTPPQGWKLHVSALPDNSTALLRAALPVLHDAGVQFKFLLDRRAVAMCGSRLWPRGSSGKFITVYPRDAEGFLILADRLSHALADFAGPYILSDRRVPGPGPVYYRYGGFTGLPQLRSDGASDLHIQAPDGTLVPDIRHPYWSAAAWLDADPFGFPAQEDIPSDDSEDDSGLLGGRFEVTEAIQFLNRGGVYRAVCSKTGAEVVLKESRPHVGTDDPRYPVDCVSLLRKEFRLLRELADTGFFVRPVSLFTEWEHTFLAEEYIRGPHLGQLTIAENPIYTSELTAEALAAYYGRIQDLFGRLSCALAVAHDRGIALGDLSWTNVLVEEETDRLVIIDLEAAVESGVDTPTGMHTPGISSPRYIRTGVPTAADDFRSLGSMLFGSIMLATSFLGYRPEALPRFLDSLGEDLGLPADFVDLVRDLTAEPGDEPPDADSVIKRFAELSVADPAAWPRRIPLAEPAAQRITGAVANRLHADVMETVAGVAGYLRGTATPARADRLFPADLMVFQTNPLSVAYGAAGVLHALHHLPGGAPDRLTAWMLEHHVADDTVPPGLYLGQSGIAWVLSELGHTAYAARLLRRAGDHPLVLARNDILQGSAGYGLACLRLWLDTGDAGFLGEAVVVGEHLSLVARHNERGAHWVALDHEGIEHVPLGYAHGSSGIALFLLYLHLATGDQSLLALGRSALDHDLSYAEPFGKVTAFRGDADPVRDPVLRSYWEHGTAGVMTTLVRYRDVTGDPALDGWIDRLLPDLKRKYAVMPQLFHGLAGIGNALLDVADLADRPEVRADIRAEAWRTAEGVLLFGVDSPEGLGFLGEQSLRESADFATGAAGIGLFLHRLLQDDPHRPHNTNFTLDDLLPRYRRPS